jgi:putative transposase
VAQRKQYRGEFKARVVLQALKGQQTLNEIASKYGVHPVQVAQFTSAAFTGRLEAADIRISMDGRGRAFDSVFVERLWRSVKYEHVYLYGYEHVPELRAGLSSCFQFYNHERFHQSLGYRTPAAVCGAAR